ncbi:MAG: hypothetical protein Q9227_004909 [Pyrenula ochraceoflavens]
MSSSNGLNMGVISDMISSRCTPSTRDEWEDIRKITSFPIEPLTEDERHDRFQGGIYHRLLGNDTVKIYVGQERRCFMIHEDLLCSHSLYFTLAFGIQSHYEATKELEFPQHDPADFDILVQRMYTGSLPGLITSTPNDEDSEIATFRGIGYYILLRKLIFPPALQLELIDAHLKALISARGPIRYSQDTMRQILREGSKRDPFRRWILDVAAYLYCFADGDSEDNHMDLVWQSGSEEDKVWFTKSVRTMLERHLRGPYTPSRSRHLRTTLGLDDFTSIADIPRYQVGYLSRDKTDAEVEAPAESESGSELLDD